MTYSSLLKKNGDKKYKIAYFPAALHHPSLDPEISQSIEQLLSQLQSQGHKIEAVDFDYLDFIVPAYYVLTTAEASSNLSRYDGIKFGHRTPTTKVDLDETFIRTPVLQVLAEK